MSIPKTRANFDKACRKLLPEAFIQAIKSPPTLLERAALVAFVEQPELERENMKKYVDLLRDLYKDLRKTGVLTFEK